MSEVGEGSGKIKVVDRRRFDQQGDLRPDRPPPEEAKPPSVVSDAGEEPVVEDREPLSPAPKEDRQTADSPASTTSPLFMDLIAGLAQQAELLMTGGQGLPAQPAESQRVIDYLTMLESKTKGNLSAEEQQILSNVVFQLRSMYVQHTR